MSEFSAVKFENDNLVLIDQIKLPLKEEYISTDNYERVAEAIERLEVRGAPLIGVAAAYAVALAFKGQGYDEDHFEKVYHRLRKTRPTAVNLFWALDEMKIHFYSEDEDADIYQSLLKKAVEIHEDDIYKCEMMAKHGLKIFRKKSTILTHCNTGQLATGGSGTAFSVIKNAYEKGLVEKVYADETRPLLQGSRLTAFELDKAGIPFSINVDSASGFLMKSGEIDLVITGADRIALNGDSANKVGTYNLAVLCKHHNIPFYIAAPTTTIDKGALRGSDIKIEFRDPGEITRLNSTKITKDSYNVYAPAFDVTPAELISGIITEEGFYRPPFNF